MEAQLTLHLRLRTLVVYLLQLLPAQVYQRLLHLKVEHTQAQAEHA